CDPLFNSPRTHLLLPFPYTTLFRSSPDPFRAQPLAPDTGIDLHQESCEPAPCARDSHYKDELHRPVGQQVPASSVLAPPALVPRSEEHTSELQSRGHLVCRLLLEKK